MNNLAFAGENLALGAPVGGQTLLDVATHIGPGTDPVLLDLAEFGS